jgi:cytochrome c-type biogenesis protein CcmH/NrfG
MLKTLFKSFFPPRGGADEWLAQAKDLRKKGEPRAALAAYRKALELGGPAAEIELQLGVLHAGLGERDRAEAHLRKAIEQAPRDPDPLCMLGTVMHDLRRFDEAARLFEQALALRPDFAEAHFNLGLARFERADFRGAAASFARCAALNRGEPWTEARRAEPSREPAPRFAPADMGVNEVKLRHDCEQLDYLLGIGRLPPVYREVLEDYRALFAEIRGKVDIGGLIPFDEASHPLVARTYKRPIHIEPAPAPEGPVVSPELDWRTIEQRYLAAEPNLVAVDNLLTPPALRELRRFCLESTFWNNIKPGYLGAYFYDGFCSELLLRAARELRECMPAVMGGQPLQMMWGYKCESRLPGLGVHADEAAVNVNFWITEDEANLDREHGGLLVYRQEAPADWGFAKFNTDSEVIQRYLESEGEPPLRVPYRTNRAVVFDSDLFHATDRPVFREGYTNRRVNITFLYGQRAR